jgi:hypothetical protein
VGSPENPGHLSMYYFSRMVNTRVANFEKNSYSAEHSTDGNFYSSRRNSVPSHSAEEKKCSELRSEPFRKR